MARVTVLLPESRRVAGSDAIVRWWSRGDRLPDGLAGREVALRACFEFLGSATPAAALTRSLDANDAAGCVWLRADPCYVMVDAVAVRMLACGQLGLSVEESAELARALRPLFGDAGFPLEAATPERWYLRCRADVRLPVFRDPQGVLGADLLPHLPSGENQRQWRHLLNEAQVILHNHPLNVRRTQRGQVPANSVWFWGAGQLPDWVRTPFTHCASDDPLLIALARLANMPLFALKVDDGFRFDAGDNLLLDLAQAPAFDATSAAALDAALGSGSVSELVLRFESGQAISYKPRHRWRFWRRIAAAGLSP